MRILVVLWVAVLVTAGCGARAASGTPTPDGFVRYTPAEAYASFSGQLTEFTEGQLDGWADMDCPPFGDPSVNVELVPYSDGRVFELDFTCETLTATGNLIAQRITARASTRKDGSWRVEEFSVE